MKDDRNDQVELSADIRASGPGQKRTAKPRRLPQYHLWTTDRRARNHYWVEASSEDVARRLVMLNADSQAEDARIWRCMRSRDQRAREGLIVSDVGDLIVIAKL